MNEWLPARNNFLKAMRGDLYSQALIIGVYHMQEVIKKEM